MAQRSILSMFKKSDQLVTEKNRTGNPVQSSRSETQVAVSEKNRIGIPVLSDCASSEKSKKKRTGNPLNESIGAETQLSNSEKNRTGIPVASDNSPTENAFLIMSSNMMRVNEKVESSVFSKSKKRKLANINSNEQATKKRKTDDSMSVEKKFNKTWLDEFKWLVFEKGAMFCSLCLTHKNKSMFSQSGSLNFRISTLREHESSSGHVKSLKTATEIKENKIPSMTVSLKEKADKIELAICRLIRTAYTVAKKHLPIQFYPELCALQICNGTLLTRKLYQDTYACSEFIKIISDYFDQTLLEKLRESPALGIMVDESTDLSMEKHLIVYMNYLEQGNLRTSFLTLLKLVSADANAVYSTLVGFLKACNIDTSKIWGFSSDGAAVMMGKDNGVVRKFKIDSPYLLEMHCIAHKLALSSLDAAKQVGEVKYFESILQSLHSYFSKSSKRIEHLRTWQDVLDDDRVKPLAVHQIRWLSFANCVTNVRRSLNSLLKSLESDSDDDVMASALFKALSSYKFLFLAHFFSDIMSDIAVVSRTFQSRDISYVTIQKTLAAVCDSIEQQYLIDDAQYGNYLREFLDKYENASDYYGTEIRRSHRDDRLPVAVSEFASILKDSLLSRFPKLELWEAMSIFSPDTFPNSVKEKATFGKAKLARLLEHFGETKGGLEPPINAEEAKREWPLFKNFMFSAVRNEEDAAIQPNSATLAKTLLSSKDMIAQYPNMTKLMSISRVLPASSVECERGFSIQNLIKTRLRCSLCIEKLDQHMRVSINGPELRSFDPVPIYRIWRKVKDRHIYAKTEKRESW